MKREIHLRGEKIRTGRCGQPCSVNHHTRDPNRVTCTKCLRYIHRGQALRKAAQDLKR